MYGVSCTSSSFCMADGFLSNGAAMFALVENWNGATWSVVANPESSVVGTSLNGGISCPSSTDCVAVGQDDPSGTGVIENWNGSAWSMAASQPGGLALDSVSCATTASCVVLGRGQTDYQALVLSGGEWTSYVPPQLEPGSVLSGVSCASPSFCEAVGDYIQTDSGWPVTLIDIWNGTSWSTSPSPNPAAGSLGAGSLGGGILVGVSCASPSACVAVGYGGGGTDDNNLEYPVVAVVETWDGTNWSLTPTPAPIEPDGGGQANLQGIACVPSSGDPACTAVGLQTPDGGTLSALVETTSAAVGSLVPTTTQLTNDGNGDLIATVSATVASSATPTGTVTILHNGIPMLSCPPQELDDADQATCSGVFGSVAAFTADYSGDANFDGSSSTQGGSTTTTTTVPTTTTTVPPTTTVPATTTIPTTTTTLPTTTTTVPTTTTVSTTTTVPPTTTVPTTTTVPATTTTTPGTPSAAVTTTTVSAATAPATATTAPPTGTTTTTTTELSSPAPSTAKTPRLAIDSASLVAKGSEIAVTLACGASACRGSVELVGSVSVEPAGAKTTAKKRSIVLASATYSLGEGKRASLTLKLNANGHAVLLQANGHIPLRGMITATVRGGVTATRAVIVGQMLGRQR